MKSKLYFNKFILPVAGLLLATGCKSAQPLLMSTPQARISQQLPPMEIVTDNGQLAMTDGAQPEDALHLFQRELRQNVLEPTDTATFGYARLVVTEARVTRANRGLQAFQMATLLMPSLFGVPLENYRTNITAEVQLLNPNGEEVACFAGCGSSDVRVAMYHGYSQSVAPRLSDLTALKAALARVRPQLDSAAGRLRPLLLSGGAVYNPTLPTTSATTATAQSAR